MIILTTLFMLLPMLGLVLIRHTIGKKSRLTFVSGTLLLFMVLGLGSLRLHSPEAQFSPVFIPALFLLPLQLPATFLFFTIGKELKAHVETLIFSGLYLSSYALTIYWLVNSGHWVAN